MPSMHEYPDDSITRIRNPFTGDAAESISILMQDRVSWARQLSKQVLQPISLQRKKRSTCREETPLLSLTVSVSTQRIDIRNGEKSLFLILGTDFPNMGLVS